jgi:hypothetical protein
MSQLNVGPPLSDENWRAFVLDKERNSALARKEWARYRRGLRRLERKYRRRAPVRAMRQSLAEDAFFCATHWRHAPGIVRGALRALLDLNPDLRLYTYAAAEYWAWAAAVSPTDLEKAGQMVKRAEAGIRARRVDPPTADNLERMLAALVRP